ncbi:MAG: D-alanyl-D-alanine carboxypeptidase/D-alanyl-D-alanine-endopeptidase [Bacteroidaceae bacterium]|nr:D-alanyl-D-alanine carboxypeptidase/D-alanyl-D-alanine-endopeptidase [Bacteroidaceae bacterium]
MTRRLLLTLPFLLLTLASTRAQDSIPAHERFDDTAALIDQDLQQRFGRLMLDPLMQQAQVGAFVYDLTDDRPLLAHGHRQRMRPASTMKVLTAVAALDQLGGDYRLTTTAFVDAPLETNLRGSLYVRGGMDPLLGHDDLQAMVNALRNGGVTTIEGDVVLDVSMKDANLLGWGWCWDDNEAPLTPLIYLGKADFSTHLLSALQSAGIQVRGQVREGRVASQAQQLVVRTHAIDQVLRPMMKRSDNLMAESMFYQIAAASGKVPATRKEGAAAIERLVTQLGLRPADYQIADGSGLSLYNYVSPELLVQTLRYAYSRAPIYDSFLPTLPIMGVDGTLQNRGQGTAARQRVWAKTGTLDGVVSLAGYAQAPNGHTLAFAFILQGVPKAAAGRAWIDRACHLLTAR